MRASYLEIYNEEIRDLLSKNPQARLELKEHPDRGVYVKDLMQFVVKSVAEIGSVLQVRRLAWAGRRWLGALACKWQFAGPSSCRWQPTWDASRTCKMLECDVGHCRLVFLRPAFCTAARWAKRIV